MSEPSPHAAAIVDLLLTVGYVDGLFHERERAFVQQYLDRTIKRVEPAIVPMGIGLDRVRGEERGPFDAIYEKLHAEIVELAAEVIASNVPGYVPTRLKVRALTIFAALPVAERPAALALVHELILADGVIAVPEQSLYDELAGYFATAAAPSPAIAVAAAAPAAPPADSAPDPRPLAVSTPLRNPLKGATHPLLDHLEHAYSMHPQELQSQIAHDYQLATAAMAAWSRLRAEGQGRLAGITDVGQLPRGARFLDGNVHVLRPDRPIELIVLGDLHGCYSCLKAAVLQSDFVERAWAHQRDPARNPEVKLVFLGDYIDRGHFSFDGVLRAVLSLFVAMPEHVIVLRGNHEYFLNVGNRTISGVAPAEALASLAPHVPRELPEMFRLLFDQMPTSFVFDRTLFVHGGIPREDTFASRFHGLSSLNDDDVRFQMMWSDPTQVDFVPLELQRKNPRFNFGTLQFRRFMEQGGFHTMVRGHEKIESGFEIVYDHGDRLLLNLFSAGGHDNNDLPLDGSYRSVTPMALTIQHSTGRPIAVPWPIEYQPFNYQPHNGFHRAQFRLPFRTS